MNKYYLKLCLGLFLLFTGQTIFAQTISADSSIITRSDPTTFVSSTPAGQGNREVFDRRTDSYYDLNVYLFNIVWSDGLSAEGQVNPEFTLEEAAAEAEKYGREVGRLPYCLRTKVKVIIIHKGVKPFAGGSDGLVIHTGQATYYENDGILEETLVHEASHTHLDPDHAASSGWLAAQKSDDQFISRYARDYPGREDVAETFLMWMAVRQSFQRIKQTLYNEVTQTVPNRLIYFDNLSLNLSPFCLPKTGTQLATANSNQTLSIVKGNTAYFNSNCDIIANIKSAGTSAVEGTTTGKVWIESKQPTNYVKRHFEIAPVTNAGIATGTITLFFTQQEFDDFNAINTVKLPTSAADATGKANLLIEKRSGVSSNGLGTPGSYSGTAVTTNPGDANIVWNSSASRWEIVFEAGGLGGFWLKTQSAAITLPLKWLNVNGSIKNSKAVINWQVEEANVESYEIEKSNNSITFSGLGVVSSKGASVNSYTFTDVNILNETTYYRVKQIDKDGKVSYSSIIKLTSNLTSQLIISPLPFKDNIAITVNKAGRAIILNAQGQVIKAIQLREGTTYVNASDFDSGVYVLQTEDGATQKIIKQ